MNQMPTPDLRDDEPLRDGSPLMGYLHVLRKAHMALVGRDEAHRRFHLMSTRGHARKYIEELMPLLLKERDRHRLKRVGARVS
ncbi:hypothetical protein [Dyella nitratireducens]|uniref:Uncharacterized protein n=1 Tax=Dyella nitratireducens TaxID=1849580 RepID=A0ABQ1GNQ3_9GAMM|nr:hypothetical protein [Dyella nitratireducens]GGA47083.1 hypothetical protein GCM10010981_40330 [Dyella nitratireducens]GLQ41535.1 hypothetical protein GCM10007902_13850 [Dyella nitratireducens]